MGSSTSQLQTLLDNKNFEIQQLKYQLECSNQREKELKITLGEIKIIMDEFFDKFRSTYLL